MIIRSKLNSNRFLEQAAAAAEVTQWAEVVAAVSFRLLDNFATSYNLFNLKQLGGYGGTLMNP